MAIEDERRDWFEMSRVFRRAVQTFKATWTIGAPAALLLIVIPEGVSVWFQSPASLSGGFSQFLLQNIALGSSGLVLLTTLLGVIFQTTVVFAALEHFGGRRTGLLASLATGFRLILPAVGLSILMTVGAIIGLVLLVIPGLFIMTVWSVSLPARLHRGPGVIEAIQESDALTKGVRWQVFGLLVIAAIIVGVSAIMLEVVVNLIPESARIINDTVLTPLFSGFASLVVCYGTASMFHELKWGGRHSEEQVTAEIFA